MLRFISKYIIKQANRFNYYNNKVLDEPGPG